MNLDPVLSPLVNTVLTPLISSLSSGTGDVVNQLVDAAVLGSTTVTVPTTITPDGSTSPVEVKGAIASSDAINLDLFAGVASSTDVLVDLTPAKANANAQIDALTALRMPNAQIIRVRSRLQLVQMRLMGLSRLHNRQMSWHKQS